LSIDIFFEYYAENNRITGYTFDRMNLSKDKIIVFWGIMDLAALGWYMVFNIVKGRIPFYSDIITAKATSVSFEAPMPSILTFISLFSYLSLIFSGYLLIKRNRFGALLSYFQCPFRLLSFIPISLFFITWPVKYVFGVPSNIEEPIQAIMQAPVIAYLALVLLSELIKTATVIRWHIMIRKKV
jgi:hypothetical protein